MLNSVLIILAGGDSSRMGSPKGLIEITPGKTLLAHALESFASASGVKAIIVFGSHASLYEARRDEWMRANAADLKIQIAINPDPKRGQFSSLKIAAELLAEGENAFVLPIDVPAPGTATWPKLIHDRVEVVTPVYKGRGGHPVWLSSRFCQRIKTQLDDARLDQMIHALSDEDRKRIEVDEPAIALNWNTPEDLTSKN